MSVCGGAFSLSGGILRARTMSQILIGTLVYVRRLALERASCLNAQLGFARGCETRSNSCLLLPKALLASSINTVQVDFEGIRIYIE